MVELAKTNPTEHNYILSKNYMNAHGRKYFLLKASIQRYKYICTVVKLIPKYFMDKYNLSIIVQNKHMYNLTQTGKTCIIILLTTWNHVDVPLPK